jgi:hypothetical protein
VAEAIACKPAKMSRTDADILRVAVNNDYRTWSAGCTEAARKVLEACPMSLIIEEVRRRNVAIPECDARGGA